jgi:soluble lytic murein transglycosylase-like protein
VLLSGLGAALGRIAQIEQTLSQLEAPPTPAQPAATGSARPDFARLLAEAKQTTATPSGGASSSSSSSSPSHRYDDIIKRVAAKYGVDEDLVHAVIQAESDYDPKCRSSAGAMGLMQIMPETAKDYGVNPWDPAQNIEGGVRELREKLNRWGDVDLALAAYNAGSGAVQRYHGIPPYRETQTYVKRVLHNLWVRKSE